MSRSSIDRRNQDQSQTSLKDVQTKFNPDLLKTEPKKTVLHQPVRTKAPKDPNKRHHSKKHEEKKHVHGEPETNREETRNFLNATKSGQIINVRNPKKGTGQSAGEADELEEYYQQKQSLEGLSLAEALEARAKAAQALAESLESPEPEFHLRDITPENDFSIDMRSASSFSMMDESPQLRLMLGEVIDVSAYLQDRLRRGEPIGLDSAEVAQLFNLANIKKKRARGLAEEEDVDTLLLVQYLPIIYDAITRIIQKGLDEEAISKMESLKGEIAELVRTASDPSSPLHSMFKDVKLSLEDREMVPWEDAA